MDQANHQIGLGSSPRGTASDEGPFLWVSKSVLERINDTFGPDTTRAALAKVVYVTLAWLLSDRQAEDRSATEFKAHIGVIAYRSGAGQTTVREAIREFEHMGLVRTQHNRLREGAKAWGPSTFTLLSSAPPNANRATSTVRRGTSPAEPSLFGVGSVQEEATTREEESKKRGARRIPPHLDEVKSQAAMIGLPESEVKRFLNHYESNGWRVGRSPMKCWQAALRNWFIGWQERQCQKPPGANGVANRRTIDHTRGFLQ
jgi:hypothetical protein